MEWEPGNADSHADPLAAPGMAPDEVFVTATPRGRRGPAAAKHQCCLHAVEVFWRVLWGWFDRWDCGKRAMGGACRHSACAAATLDYGAD